MTFNKKESKDKLFTPLLKSDLERGEDILFLIDQIEINFLDFSRYYSYLREFARKIPILTRKEYEKTKDEVHYTIQLIPSILYKINQLTERVWDKDKKDLTEEIKEKLEIIKEKLNPKVAEIPILINEIYEKERIASLKLRNIKLSESQLDDSLSFIHNRSDNIRESRLLAKEVYENQTYLEKRKDELESIKKVSTQLKEITVMMGKEVKYQGEQLNQILNDVEVAREDVFLGESEIDSAEKKSRGQMKKIIIISALIFLVVAVIITLIVLSVIN